MPFENPLFMIRPTRLSFLKEYFLAFLMFALIFFLNMSQFQILDLSKNLAISMAVLFVLSVEYERVRRVYKITPSQVIGEYGIVTKRRDSVFLNNITDVNVQQNFLQRFIGVGNLTIGPSSGRGVIEMKGIANPHGIALEMEKLIEKYVKEQISKPETKKA